jgi:hypothetical protein
MQVLNGIFLDLELDYGLINPYYPRIVIATVMMAALADYREAERYLDGVDAALVYSMVRACVLGASPSIAGRLNEQRRYADPPLRYLALNDSWIGVTSRPSCRLSTPLS